jgi:hypothetical protein
MPTLFQPEHATQEPLSPGRPLAEDNTLDPDALRSLREFFLILDSWYRADVKKVSPDVRSPVDNPPHQAQGGGNNKARSGRAE